MGADNQKTDLRWDPVTEEEKALKKALADLVDSSGKGVVKGPNSGQKFFILKSRGYYDLRAYVMTGKEFPRTESEFTAKLPEAAFRKLIEIDPLIYAKTRDTMIAIGSSCYEYHRDHLGKLVTAAGKATQFSHNALGLLEEEKDINLKHHINILLDPKYLSEAYHDAAFRDAREGAQMTLAMLRDDAKEKESEVDEIKATMIAFREETAKRRDAVQFLTKQYQTGPVTSSSSIKQPYLKYLRATLMEQVEACEALVEDARKNYKDWDEAKNVAIGTAFLGPLGWIAMTIKSIQADNFWKAFQRLQEQIDRMRKENLDETTFIEYVTRMIEQYKDIEGKMTDAINAMTELVGLFQEQAACYDKISLYLNGMHSGTSSNSAATRKAYINTMMNQAIVKLRELKELATEVVETIIHEIPL